MRLAAMIGDGHTTAWWSSRMPMMRTPLRLFVFADGVYVVDATPDHAWAIGGRVVEVGGKSIADVVAMLAETISHDNQSQLDGALPDRLTDPMVLDGLGLAEPELKVRYRIELPDASTRDATLGLERWRPSARTGKDVPLGRRNHHLRYWNDFLPEQKLVYLQYNQCADAPDVSFAQFTANTLAFVDQNPVETFVVDLRNNPGGNSRLARPLIEGLGERKLKVYALIGRATFSSGLLNAIELDQNANAILVGEPTGGRPSHYGEVLTFELPALSMTVQYSTKYFEYAEYAGDALQPEVDAAPTAVDYFAGRDRALEVALAE
jgi:hypothetical protein